MTAPLATSFLQDQNFIAVLYIVAFGLFILGLMGLTGPKTAVRGNRIAAVGMAVAVIATLLTPGLGNWGLIIIGIVIGTVVGGFLVTDRMLEMFKSKPKEQVETSEDLQ